MLSTQNIAKQYRVDIIALLGRLGYGTTKQIARAVWGGAVTQSTKKMANRTITAMLKRGLLVEKRDSVAGERLVALTAAGVAQGEYELPKAKSHARDWLRHAHSHRTAANSVYVAADALVAIHGTGYTELEIRAGQVPEKLSIFSWTNAEQIRLQKIPDCIIQTDEGYVWVEVENSYRSDKDFDKAISWMRAMFHSVEPPVTEVWFVITGPGAATIGKRLAVALGRGNPHTDGRGSLLRELDARILSEKIRVFELDHDTLTTKPIVISTTREHHHE